MSLKFELHRWLFDIDRFVVRWTTSYLDRVRYISHQDSQCKT